MQEYERTITTVCNSYVRPIVSRYVRNLNRELGTISGDVNLHILRSDGGLTSPVGAETVPVNLLMSGPAGGVTGALWIARQAGFDDLLTFDMGGHLDGRVPRQGGCRANPARDDGRRSHRARLVGRRALGRCGRRLDCACARADEGASRGAGERRRRSWPGGLRQRRHGADRDRREYRPRPFARSVAARRRPRARPGKVGGRCRQDRERMGSRRSAPPRASTTSSTRP